MSEYSLALRLPPRPDFCRVARERLVNFTRAHGLCEDDIAYLVAAVGEALANAIEHAHSSAPIQIDVEVSDDRVVAVIHDAGVGFVGEPDLPARLPAVDAERGRGLAIMRRCSDIFSISSPPGEGTVVTIGRYRRHPAAFNSVA
jgi:anti-sigma regulatory factor (Ser/Thr protein kinase)